MILVRAPFAETLAAPVKVSALSGSEATPQEPATFKLSARSQALLSVAGTRGVKVVVGGPVAPMRITISDAWRS